METTVLPAADSVTIRLLAGAETLVVTGPDRGTWLDGLVTCEVKNLSPGQGAWGLLLNRLGKIQSPFYALETGDSLLLAVSAGTGDDLLPELDRMLIMEDAEVARPVQAWHWYLLHGPQAAGIANQLCTGGTGHCATVDPLNLGGAVLAVGQVLPEKELKKHGAALLTDPQWTAFRLAHHHPEFGVDYSTADRPHEAALERKAVNWNKGCYLGQEVVCMQDMRGKVKSSNRVISFQAPPTASIPPKLAVCGRGGEAVGTMTSAAFSPTTGQWLGMARLKLERADEGLTVDLGDSGTVTASLVAAPEPTNPIKQ